MNANTKKLVILGALAVSAYFAYRWWVNRQNGTDTGGLPQLGTNLNSVAPDLLAGPGGGVQYTAPSTTVAVSGSSETVNPPTPKPPVKKPKKPWPVDLPRQRASNHVTSHPMIRHKKKPGTAAPQGLHS